MSMLITNRAVLFRTVHHMRFVFTAALLCTVLPSRAYASSLASTSAASICLNKQLAKHSHHQVVFQGHPSAVCSRTMASSTTPDPAIQEILDFWFGLDPGQWFTDAQLDKPIKERFSHLVEKARLTNELDSTWLSTPSGSLAMILLLDQFTRNIFRPGNHENPGLSWSGDAKALRIATNSIAKGFDRQIEAEYASHEGLGISHRIFVYMPYMHAEDLLAQVTSCALFESMKNEFETKRLQRQIEGKEETEQEKAVAAQLSMSVPFAAKHRDCVAAVGRFPKRNEPLGRTSSQAEIEWLEKYPQGF